MARVATLRARDADIAKAEAEFRPRIVVAGDLGQNIGRVRTEGLPGWSNVNQPAYGAAIAIELADLRRRSAARPSRGGAIAAADRGG